MEKKVIVHITDKAVKQSELLPPIYVAELAMYFDDDNKNSYTRATVLKAPSQHFSTDGYEYNIFENKSNIDTQTIIDEVVSHIDATGDDEIGKALRWYIESAFLGK